MPTSELRELRGKDIRPPQAGFSKGPRCQTSRKQTNRNCLLLGNTAVHHRGSSDTSAPSSLTQELGSLTVRLNFSPSCARAKWISWNTNQINAQRGLNWAPQRRAFTWTQQTKLYRKPLVSRQSFICSLLPNYPRLQGTTQKTETESLHSDTL